eukprot:gene16891-12089_t
MAQTVAAAATNEFTGVDLSNANFFAKDIEPAMTVCLSLLRLLVVSMLLLRSHILLHHHPQPSAAETSAGRGTSSKTSTDRAGGHGGTGTNNAGTSHATAAMGLPRSDQHFMVSAVKPQ